MRISVLAPTIVTALAACSPSTPELADPVRDVHYTVTTTASTLDRRFLVEFRSLSDRELCISANDWPTRSGALGINRSPEDGDEVQRVRAGETISAFVRFDQVEAAQRRGDGVHQVDFSPKPFFCTSELQ